MEWAVSKNRKNGNCLNDQFCECQIVISLKSIPGRIEIVHKTIRSILNQNIVKPDRVELWLQ